MLFNSYSFLFVFLPVVLAVYWSVRSDLSKKIVSVGGSYIFYGVWSVKFAALMFATTSVDYFTAKRISAAETRAVRRAWLAGSLTVNLAVLGLFKYYDFFAGSLNGLLPAPMLPMLRVILPIGISFYTFESMSYCIDVYRGLTRPARRLIDYAHFVTMFPRLIAGPIVRYTEFAVQTQTMPREQRDETWTRGIHFLVVGLIKKVLIADTIAASIDPLFRSAGELGLAAAWTAALGYTAQLYMDFSGYCDMAVGLGLFLGFTFPRNFNLPYKSLNIAEFWRRWHVSLSTWLRDYLYIPLGGNRGGAVRTQINLLVTMLLGGLWHGAQWTFVCWGAFHGVALIVHRQFDSRLGARIRIPSLAAFGLTFLTIVTGWVMFRAATVSDALTIYRAMLGVRGLGLSWLAGRWMLVAFVVTVLGVSCSVDTYDVREPLRTRDAMAYAFAFVVCVTRFFAPSPFLYFQF